MPSGLRCVYRLPLNQMPTVDRLPHLAGCEFSPDGKMVCTLTPQLLQLTTLIDYSGGPWNRIRKGDSVHPLGIGQAAAKCTVKVRGQRRGLRAPLLG